MTVEEEGDDDEACPVVDIISITFLHCKLEVDEMDDAGLKYMNTGG